MRLSKKTNVDVDIFVFFKRFCDIYIADNIIVFINLQLLVSQ